MLVKKSKLVIAVTAILATGGVTAYLYLKSLTEKVSTPLESAKIVPASAIAATFISPNPKALAQLQQFGSPEAQRLIQQGFKNLQSGSFSGANIDFDRDVKPWVGGLTVALLPPSATEKAGEARLLLVLEMKNEIAAWRVASYLKSQAKTKSSESEYKGVKIAEITEEGGRRYSMALLNQHLVFAPFRKAVEQAVDTLKGEPSLASQSGIASSFLQSAGVANPMATLLIANYSALMQQLNNLPDNAIVPASVMSQLQQVKSVVVGIGVDSGGIRLRSVAELDPKFVKPPHPVASSSIIQKFPAETIALLSGQGFNQIWSQAVVLGKNHPEIATGLSQVREGFRRVELDADREVFRWMDGEFAVGAIASNQGILDQLGMGGAMIFETSDRTAAEATLRKLDAIAGSNPSVSVAPRKVKGKEVTEWQIPQQGTLFGHGWLDRNAVFVAFGGPLVDVMTVQQAKPLSQSTPFRAIANSLPQPNQGYFYLDVDKALSWANRYLLKVQPNLISPEATVLLNSVEGIGVTTTWPKPSTLQLEMLLALKPKKK